MSETPKTGFLTTRLILSIVSISVSGELEVSSLSCAPQAGLFKSNLRGNPKDKFSSDEAQTICYAFVDVYFPI